jgi:hypothetical protein
VCIPAEEAKAYVGKRCIHQLCHHRLNEKMKLDNKDGLGVVDPERKQISK